MQIEIEEALNHLIGLPLWKINRTLNMASCSFGERHLVTQGDKHKFVGTWALHIQCEWRLRSSEKILFASYDRREKADRPKDSADDLGKDVQGETQLDQRIATFMEGRENSLVVTKISANNVGDLAIELDSHFYLESFTNVSLEDYELWRLFQPYSESPHFVVTSSGIED